MQVEFPEARIFEETLNILIYETPRGPDPALLEATGGAAGGGGASRGEDEDNREHESIFGNFKIKEHYRRINSV